MPSIGDSVAGLKLNAGIFTILFRIIVLLASVAGAWTVTSFWLRSDEHNDERYVKKAELQTAKLESQTEIRHLTQLTELKLVNIENLIRAQTEIIKNIHK